MGLCMLMYFFLPDSYKTNLIKCLLLRTFIIRSNWPQFNCQRKVYKQFPSNLLEFVIHSSETVLTTKPIISIWIYK